MLFTPYVSDDSRIIACVRLGSEVASYIDLHQGLRHGVPFFISANRAILLPGIEGVIANMFSASDKQAEADGRVLLLCG